MTYAIYTRSHPADTDCKADREQYQRCLDFAARYRLGNPCRIIPIRLLCPQTERPTVCKICLKISALGRSMAS